MTERPTPFGAAWWVDDHLLAGAYPGSRDAAEAEQKVDALVAAGVTQFIDLTTDADRMRPYAALVEAVERDPHVRRVCIPVPDMTAPTRAQVQEALDLIDAEAAAGGVTYLHCWGGHGRTGSVVGCYLAREIGGEAALERITHLRRNSSVAHMAAPQTHEQRALVRSWPKTS